MRNVRITGVERTTSPTLSVRMINIRGVGVSAVGFTAMRDPDYDDLLVFHLVNDPVVPHP